MIFGRAKYGIALIPLVAIFIFVFFKTDNNKIGTSDYDTWNIRLESYIETARNTGYNVLINGTNRYLNFNTISGEPGYGIRDNSGTIEFKNSGGSWSAPGGSGTVTSVGMTVPTGLTVSGVPITTTGTATIALDSGYVIPLTASTTNWSTAYGWGNHDGLYPTFSYASSTYSPLAGSTTITTVGTIGTGTWNATAIANAKIASSTEYLQDIAWNGSTVTNGTITNLTASTSTLSSLSVSDISIFGSSPPKKITGYEKVLFMDEDGGASDWSFNVADLGWGVTNFGKSRGTLSSPLIVSSNDIFGSIDSYGYDGSSFKKASAITFLSGGTPGIGDMPGKILFTITPDGTSTPANSLLLDANQDATFYGTIFATDGFQASTSNITNLTVTTGTGTTIIATTRLDIPSSATLHTPNSGDIGIDSTSGQFRYNYGSATATIPIYQDKTITIASSTWNSFGGTATSTIQLGFAIEAQTWSSVGCYTDTATTTVNFGDGTNWMGDLVATTSPILYGVASNNTFTALEKIYIRISRFTGSPNQLSCTIKRSIDPN